MKKLSLFGLTAVLIPALVLAGCGGGSPPPPAGWATDNPLGSHWSDLISSSFGLITLDAVAYGNNVFVSGGSNGQIARSTNNGQSWSSLIPFPFTTSINPQQDNAIRAIAYGNGVFVAVGDKQIARSTDYGQSWTKVGTIPFTTIIDAVAFGTYGSENIFLAAGFSGQIARSTDGGQTWGSLIANPSSGIIRSIAYGDGVFVAGDSSGNILRSVDGGLTWQSVAGNPVGDIYIGSIAYGEYDGIKVFVAKGNNEIILRSVDLGITWERINLGSIYSFSQPFMGLVYGEGVFVAVGHKIARSTDAGRTWALVDTSETDIFSSGLYLLTAAYGDGTMVATGHDRKITRSNN